MIENIIIFLFISMILIRVCFYVGKWYGYLMTSLVIIIVMGVIPIGYIIKKYYYDKFALDYMVYYQQGNSVNDINWFS
jgi:hypothetical protein